MSDDRPDRAERIRWHTAEQQVEAFLDVLTRRYGLREDELPALISALRWASEYKANLGRLAIAGLVALLGLAVGGIGALLVEGLKHYLKDQGGA